MLALTSTSLLMLRKETSAVDLDTALPWGAACVGEFDCSGLKGLATAATAAAPADNAVCVEAANTLRASIALKLSNNRASS